MLARQHQKSRAARTRTRTRCSPCIVSTIACTRAARRSGGLGVDGRYGRGRQQGGLAEAASLAHRRRVATVGSRELNRSRLGVTSTYDEEQI